MAGQVRSGQVPDLIQVSGGRFKCRGGFCRHGPLAVWAETWQGDGDPPRKANPMFGLGTPTAWVRGSKNGVSGTLDSLQPKRSISGKTS